MRPSVTDRPKESDSILVIGWGNALRGDDAAGIRVARTVSARAWPGVRVIECHQPTPELAEDVARARRVVFVDAVDDRTAEHVRVSHVRTADTPPPDALGHHLEPVGLLSLARSAYGGEPEAWTVAVPARQFDRPDCLSPLTAAAVNEAVKVVEGLVHTRPEAEGRPHDLTPPPRSPRP